jgi:hypothetical protein
MRSEVGYGSYIITLQCKRCWDEYHIDAEGEWWICDREHRHYSLVLSDPDRILTSIWVERHEGPFDLRRAVGGAPLSLWQSLW